MKVCVEVVRGQGEVVHEQLGRQISDLKWGKGTKV